MRLGNLLRKIVNGNVETGFDEIVGEARPHHAQTDKADSGILVIHHQILPRQLGPHSQRLANPHKRRDV